MERLTILVFPKPENGVRLQATLGGKNSRGLPMGVVRKMFQNGDIMRIIIVGCGKVGYTLVEQLSKEDHDLVVIDENSEKIAKVTDDLDAMGVVGNGVSHNTLMEAGIMDTDLLIAVTDSDEQNLLCCLIAKKTGHCKIIARVRNPIYNSEINFLQKEFGLALIINPEYATAVEMARIFQFPSAIKIDSLANGKVELLHFKVAKGSRLDGEKVINIRNSINSNILVSAVTRNDKVIIPNGDFVFQENDKVSIVGVRHDTVDFFKKIGMMTNQIHNALIAGGGKISYYLAKSLINAGIKVTIIELKRERCEELSELLPKARIICGDVTDRHILEEEGFIKAESFAALTGLDEENILVSLYAKGVSKAKIFTKINRINFVTIINNLNLDSIVNPRLIMADYIVRYVRSLKNSENSNVENLYKLEDGKTEVLEFKIKEKSEVTDVPLQELNIKNNILICSIYRDGKIIIPSGQDMIKVNDAVVVVLAGHRISDIKEILV